MEQNMSADPKNNEQIKDMPEKKLDKDTAQDVKGGKTSLKKI
jgi:hypothetical protein